MDPKLTSNRLARRAVVYIRQSSPDQVLHHQESQRLQYGLVQRARQLGFAEIRVIDDDLGRSGDGKVQTTWRRTVHFFFFLGFLRCWGSSTRSCALAANTSRTAS